MIELIKGFTFRVGQPAHTELAHADLLFLWLSH